MTKAKKIRNKARTAAATAARWKKGESNIMNLDSNDSGAQAVEQATQLTASECLAIIIGTPKVTVDPLSLDLTTPLLLPEGDDWVCEMVGNEIMVVNSPRVVVCRTCKFVLSNPRDHFKRCHDLGIPSEFFSLCHLENSSSIQRNSVVDAIPELEVSEGYRCFGCGWCWVNKYSATACGCEQSLPKLEFGVKMQSLLVRGSQKSAVAVRLHVQKKVPVIQSQLAFDKEAILRANLPRLQELTAKSFREMNRFYVELGWFLGADDLERAKASELPRYFLTPEGVSSTWEQVIFAELMEAFKWADSVSESLRALVDYFPVQAATKHKYCMAFIDIVSFCINLSRRPIVVPFECNCPFNNLAEEVANNPNKNTLFDLIQALMSQTQGFGYTVIEGMIRSFCVDRKTFSLKNPRFVQPITSRIMKLFRVAALAIPGLRASKLRERSEEALTDPDAIAELRLSEEEDDDDFLAVCEDESMEEGAPAGDTASGFGSIDGEILDLAKYLQAKSLYPINIVVMVAVKARTHAESLEAHILTLEDPLSICYNGVVVDLRDLASGYGSYLEKAKKLLSALSLGVDTQVSMNDLSENFSNVALEHKGGDEVTMRLLNTILSNPQLFESAVAFFSQEKKVVFKESFWKSYLKLHNELEQCLTALIHLGGGMVGRGTELETFRFTKVNGFARHVFLFRKHLFINPEYNKTNLRGKSITQYRFFDEELSRLMMQNFLFIRPFMHTIAKSHLREYKSDYLTHVFVESGKALASKSIRMRITNALARWEFPVSFADLRQIVKYMFNECSKSGSEGISERVIMMLINNGAALQQGHSELTSSSEYGLIEGGSKTFNRLQFVSQLAVSEKWHNILKTIPAKKNSDWSATPEAPEAIVADNSLLKVSTTPLLNASVALVHRISPFAVATERPRMAPFDTAEIDKHALGPVVLRSNELLKEVFGQKAVWKSEGQKSLCNIAIAGASSCLGVLPTNGGKSASYILLATSKPRALTIVLTPTIALREQVLQKAKELLINSSDEVTENSQGLTVLTVQKLLTDEWTRKIVCQLGMQGRITRVFIDEAHTLISHSFRDNPIALAFLATWVPVTLLTATAPVRITAELNAIFSPGKPLREVRMSTDRSNLEYIVSRVDSVVNRVEELKTLVKSVQGAVIVFFSSIQELERSASTLAQCGVVTTKYHAELESSERSNSAQVWCSQEIRVMLATTAFGEGIDLASVRLVVLYGLPYCLEDLVQMAGRAGRDEKTAKVILLYSKESSRVLLDSNRSLASSDLESVTKFADWTGCRREYLNLAMDNKSVHCLDRENTVHCDNCTILVREGLGSLSSRAALSSVTNSLSNYVLESSTRRLQGDSVLINNFLSKSMGKCAICFAAGDSLTAINHDIRSCTRVNKAQTDCFHCRFASRFHGLGTHTYTTCPFTIDAKKNLCIGCWFPTKVCDRQTHPGNSLIGFQCSVFSVRLYWIFKLALTCQSAKEVQDEYQKLAVVSSGSGFLVGVNRFIQEVILTGNDSW
jgi:superfamily II DNA helicase RecQ